MLSFSPFPHLTASGMSNTTSTENSLEDIYSRGHEWLTTGNYSQTFNDGIALSSFEYANDQKGK